MFERYSLRARQVIFVALWSAKRRGGSYIEPEDLLLALIREDRGEFAVIGAQLFPGAPGLANLAGSHRRFFSDAVATSLLRELHEDTDRLKAATPGNRREPMPRGDVPVSRGLKEVLLLVAKAHQQDTKTIEPLDLLAAIVENHDSQLAQLLLDHGITRQEVAEALG